MIEQPLEIGLNGPQMGSWFNRLYHGPKGPPGQPPGTTWLTYDQIDAQVARQIKTKIEAACKTAPIADVTVAARAALLSLSAYLDVLSDPNTVTQVVAEAVQQLTTAGKLAPLVGCGGNTPAGTTQDPTGTTAALSSPNNLVLVGAAALAFLVMMRRR